MSEHSVSHSQEPQESLTNMMEFRPHTHKKSIHACDFLDPCLMGIESDVYNIMVAQNVDKYTLQELVIHHSTWTAASQTVLDVEENPNW